MKLPITISGWIYRDQASWQNKPNYGFTASDRKDADRILLCEYTIKVSPTVSHVDCIAERVAALREAKTRAYVTAEEVVKTYDKQIQSLLMLTNESTDTFEG